MKVIVIGSGGREHAICWKIAESSLVSEVVCIPGNGGTQHENKCRNLNPADCPAAAGLSGADALAATAIAEKCDLAVIGPEDPLAAGIADTLAAAGIPVVGPRKAAAQLEASKDEAKAFMKKYGVACADSDTFTDIKAAHAYIDAKGAPIVIKADGLAAGKGVVVAATKEQAHKAVDDFMQDGLLGNAGKRLVIEEYLKGVEISILAAVSVTPDSAAAGKACIIPFTTARDHKRLNDGAKGPNTGGMGAISPVSDVTPDQLVMFNDNILEPTLKGLIAEKYDYRGFIFFGIMLTSSGPKLLEYNVRLGDPETQAVLPLMDFDFAAMCKSITEGTLKDFDFRWKKGFVCAPVAVSGGYPGSYKKGMEISGVSGADNASGASGANTTDDGTKVFIAGAQDKDGKLLTSGGRVLAASAFAPTFDEAWKKSYELLKSINFDGMFYRKDIGLPGAAESGDL